MVNKPYIPEEGDIVYMNFSPSVGHEQTGPRPAVVVSRSFFNKVSVLALVVPITSKEKGWPFEVKINSEKIKGVALVDHVRSVDYVARKIKFTTKSKSEEIQEIKDKLKALVS